MREILQQGLIEFYARHQQLTVVLFSLVWIAIGVGVFNALFSPSSQKSAETKADAPINQAVQNSPGSTNQQAGGNIINIHPPANGKLDKEERNKKIRIGLGNLHHKGLALAVKCETSPNVPEKVLYDEFAKWDHEVRDFIMENLDISYHTRFQDPTGLMLPPIPSTLPPQHAATWRYVTNRLPRLQEFIKEYPP